MVVNINDLLLKRIDLVPSSSECLNKDRKRLNEQPFPFLVYYAYQCSVHITFVFFFNEGTATRASVTLLEMLYLENDHSKQKTFGIIYGVVTQVGVFKNSLWQLNF